MRAVVAVGLLLLASAGPAQAAFGLPDASPKGAPAPIDLDPSPHLTPRQVVEVQLGALGANAAWGQDRGLELTFRFASPSNRSSTGPFPRFAQMVKSGYGALLDHVSATVGDLQMHHGRALIPVMVRDARGRGHGFLWVLGRQTEGEHRDAWMTDAVLPADPQTIFTDVARMRI